MLCGILDGKGVWGRRDTCICMAESLRYLLETALFVNQLCVCVCARVCACSATPTPIQNQKLKKNKNVHRYKNLVEKLMQKKRAGREISDD